MIGHRKLIAFIWGTVANSLLAWHGSIDPGVYSVVAVALAGGFFGANVAENLKGSPK